nr:MAG TPA: hypothetical protein [Caudoviricetes sp.]
MPSLKFFLVFDFSLLSPLTTFMLHLTTSFYFDFPSPSRYNKNNLQLKGG